MTERLDCDVLVIGSGPGGAMTAALLAEEGLDVVLLEEGGHHTIESAENYTLAEMNQKYRNGGLTPAFGKANVTYIEGRCVGGASEVNAALYHRPLDVTLRDWQLRNQIDGFERGALDEHFDAIEREIGVNTFPDGVGPASERLKTGAKKLGWKSGEVARFWRFDQQGMGSQRGRRQSMSETLIPRAIAAGCRLYPDTRVVKLEIDGPTARRAVAEHLGPGATRTPVEVVFQHVFVCGGAVQTPALLRRSGWRKNVGNSLRMHPMVRIAARFADPINDPSWGVPVQQVEEFKPRMTLGCSHSSLPHIALWLAGAVENKARRLAEWEHIGVFYVAVCGAGLGSVRNLPGFTEPLVRYPIGDEDMALLGEGLWRLGQLVFAAGAQEIFSPIEGLPAICHPDQLSDYRIGLPYKGSNVTTIHLFSSCPFGEDVRRCPVDSWGRVHGSKNIYVNDSSLLPDTPGVNPQGTILAIARRNVQRFIEQQRVVASAGRAAGERLAKVG